MKNAIAPAFALLITSAALAQLPPPSEQADSRSSKAQAQQQQGAALANPESTSDSVVQNPLGGIATPQAPPEKARRSEKGEVERKAPSDQPDANPDYLAIWTGLAGAVFGALAGAGATIYIGRRQAKAAEEANAIARASYAADVRWNDLSLVYSSFYDGENSIRATIKNYGSGVASIGSSTYTISADGIAIQALIQEDVSGVLGPAEEQAARFNFALNNGIGTRVHDGKAVLLVTCEASLMTEGKPLRSKSTFIFDRGVYGFRHKAYET